MPINSHGRRQWQTRFGWIGHWLLLAASSRVLVEGVSMWPTLSDGDRLLVSRLAYRVIRPKRGDIVLLHDPSRPGYECIKRIVALPGERVQSYGLGVTIESASGASTQTGRRLATDEYFVLGDNVEHSRDSRAFGSVPRKALLGPAWYRYASRTGRRGRL